MKILKNKKSEEGATGLTWSLILGLIVAAAVLTFVVLWWRGLLDYGAKAIKDFFRNLFR